jgi:hypothetical protein
LLLGEGGDLFALCEHYNLANSLPLDFLQTTAGWRHSYSQHW